MHLHAAVTAHPGTGIRASVQAFGCSSGEHVFFASRWNTQKPA